MAGSNILDTRTVNYMELIGNGRKYAVPAYQRDYSWSEEQWEDLWNDITDLTKSSDEYHYMGTLVMESAGDREFLVINGQQRLITLSILSLAIISKLNQMAEQGKDSKENKERADELRKRFIGEKDPASLVESSRFRMNSTDDAFFQDHLIQLRKPINPRGLSHSNQLLWKCYCYFCGKLDESIQPQGSGQAMAEILTETVGRQFLFILITVNDDLNAYTVFETLNARGLELTTTDLLKNYLFSHIEVPSDLEALQRRWRSLIMTVPQERFPELLRFHYLCDMSKVRSRRLFAITRERVRRPEQVFELMNVLERRAHIFAAMQDPNHEYWIENPDARRYIQELALFRVRQAMPLLFTAWENSKPEQFIRILKLVTVISFRYSIICSRNANALEPIYHLAAKAVADGKATTAAVVFSHLQPIYVDDERFRSDFTHFEAKTRGQGKTLTKYILVRLEMDASDDARLSPITDSGTIEHILPENPTDAWEEDFDDTSTGAMTYRLGNLTLLEAPANREIGNRPYGKKLDAYGRSRYVLTKRLPETAPERWTPEHINERQRRMADRAVHIWRADFV